MKFLIGLAVIAAIAFLIPMFNNNFNANASSDGSLEDAIETEVGKIFKRKISNGLVIGVFKQNKLYIRGFGITSDKISSPPTEDTIFQIASLTKLFTVATAQILVDEGVFRFEDTLGTLIGDKIPLSSDAEKITLTQLATHTSGLPRIPKSFHQYVPDINNPYKSITRDNVLAYLAETKGMGRVGKMAYSNYGVGLLGHVMELVTGQSLSSLMTEKILKPLKMENTGFTVPEAKRGALASGHAANNQRAPIWEFGALEGAGGLFGTAQDLMKFVRANLEEKTPIGRSLAKMRNAPSSKNGLLGWEKPMRPDRYAGNKDIIWHNGQVGGFTSYLSLDLVRNTGVVMLSNKSIDLTMAGIMMTRRVRKHNWAGD